MCVCVWGGGTYTCIYICTYVFMYILTRTITDTHTHTHTQVNNSLVRLSLLELVVYTLFACTLALIFTGIYAWSANKHMCTHDAQTMTHSRTQPTTWHTNPDAMYLVWHRHGRVDACQIKTHKKGRRWLSSENPTHQEFGRIMKIDIHIHSFNMYMYALWMHVYRLFLSGLTGRMGYTRARAQKIIFTVAVVGPHLHWSIQVWLVAQNLAIITHKKHKTCTTAGHAHTATVSWPVLHGAIKVTRETQHLSLYVSIKLDKTRDLHSEQYACTYGRFVSAAWLNHTFAISNQTLHKQPGSHWERMLDPPETCWCAFNHANTCSMNFHCDISYFRISVLLKIDHPQKRDSTVVKPSALQASTNLLV